MMEDICSMACIHRNNFKAGSFFDATTFQTNGLPLLVYLTFGLKNLLIFLDIFLVYYLALPFGYRW